MYTVQKGDTLSKISKEQYGDANKYQQIFEANKPMLTHPDKIYPGQVLRIPPRVSRRAQSDASAIPFSVSWSVTLTSRTPVPASVSGPTDAQQVVGEVLRRRVRRQEIGLLPVHQRERARAPRRRRCQTTKPWSHSRSIQPPIALLQHAEVDDPADRVEVVGRGGHEGDEVVAVQVAALALVAEHAVPGGELDASGGGDHDVLLDGLEIVHHAVEPAPRAQRRGRGGAGRASARSAAARPGMSAVPCAAIGVVPVTAAITRSRGNAPPFVRASCVRSVGCTFSVDATGPSPRASTPWHEAQARS